MNPQTDEDRIDAILSSITPGEDDSGEKVYLVESDYKEARQALLTLVSESNLKVGYKMSAIVYSSRNESETRSLIDYELKKLEAAIQPKEEK